MKEHIEGTASSALQPNRREWTFFLLLAQPDSDILLPKWFHLWLQRWLWTVASCARLHRLLVNNIQWP